MELEEVIKLKQRAEEDIVAIIRKLHKDTGVDFDQLTFEKNTLFNSLGGIVIDYKVKLSVTI